MGLVLVLRWCPPLVLTTQSDIAMWWPNSTTCPELALIPFTKPCSASWSSHQKQSCRVDYLDLPFKSWFWVSDLCLKKIRCRAGAAEWGLRFRVYPAVFSEPMLVRGWNCFKLTTGVDRSYRPNCYLLLFAKIIKRSDRFFTFFGGHCRLLRKRQIGLRGSRRAFHAEIWNEKTKLIYWESRSRKWALSAGGSLQIGWPLLSAPTVILDLPGKLALLNYSIYPSWLIAAQSRFPF